MTVCYSLPRPRLRLRPAPHRSVCNPTPSLARVFAPEYFRSHRLTTLDLPCNLAIPTDSPATFALPPSSFYSLFPLAFSPGRRTMQRGSALCVRSVSFGFTAVPLLVGDDSLGHYALLHPADRSFLGVSWSDCRLRPRSQTRVSQHYA